MTDYSNTATEAVIYLKDGKRKYGMLMLDGHVQITNSYHFISNNHVSLFNETQNAAYIEILDNGLIEAIDVNLK